MVRLENISKQHGVPSIGRCPQTQVQDGNRGSVKYDLDDRFCKSQS